LRVLQQQQNVEQKKLEMLKAQTRHKEILFPGT